MSIAQHINGLVEYHFHGLFTCVDYDPLCLPSTLSIPFRKAQVPIRPSDDGFLFLGNLAQPQLALMTSKYMQNVICIVPPTWS